MVAGGAEAGEGAGRFQLKEHDVYAETEMRRREKRGTRRSEREKRPRQRSRKRKSKKVNRWDIFPLLFLLSHRIDSQHEAFPV